MRFYQTIVGSPSSQPITVRHDLTAQLVNSLCVGIGACAIVAGTGNLDDFMPMRMLLLFGGGMLALISLRDEIINTVQTWLRPKPALEVKHVAETPAERQARMECVLLLEESRKIFGGTSRQIASDDKLKWGSTRRLRVVKYLAAHTMKENKGSVRGTFLRDYTLGEAIVALRNKSLTLQIED